MQVALVIHQIFHRRWNAPVLAQLEAQGGEGGFAVLAGELGVTPSSLSRSIGDLTERGWLRRRERLEPPYRLTRSGRRIAIPIGEWLARRCWTSGQRTPNRALVGLGSLRAFAVG